MEFVKRGTTKRNASNAIAITNRLEGSKVVLDALERTKSDRDIAFLKPAAESAIAILYSIRVSIILKRFGRTDFALSGNTGRRG